jgi:hypothetical protein
MTCGTHWSNDSNTNPQFVLYYSSPTQGAPQQNDRRQCLEDERFDTVLIPLFIAKALQKEAAFAKRTSGRTICSFFLVVEICLGKCAEDTALI